MKTTMPNQQHSITILTCLISTAMTMAIPNAHACLPLSEYSVMVGRLADSSPLAPLPAYNQYPSWVKQRATNQAMYQVDIHRLNFPFRKFCFLDCSPSPERFYSNFDITLAEGSLVVVLADYIDGDYPHDYVIATMASLSCADDKIIIDDPIVPYFGWNKKTNNCTYDPKRANGIFDGFKDGDQQSHIKQLQAKYPTCSSLDKAFPISNKSDNINNIDIKNNSNDTKLVKKTGFWAWIQSWF